LIETMTKPSAGPLLEDIRRYWNERIHDLAVAKHPVGTPGFFEDLDEYRFDKLRYLPRLVDFNGYAGRELLEVGCGAGIDLARFARGGARVTGVDLSKTAADLASANLRQRGLPGAVRVMDGERLDFPDARFDVVYAHGVLQYTADPRRMAREVRRVLRPGGEAIFMVYNRISWLPLMRRLCGVSLEHEDAPVLRTFSPAEFRELLSDFPRARLVTERFPVKTRLHGGWKAFLYNALFVGGFNALPKALVRPFGWHIMAFARKEALA
jgi:SAM-dependent methyltransferase